jgi:thiosulfate dehydrogenase [quinone] large subunit
MAKVAGREKVLVEIREHSPGQLARGARVAEAPSDRKTRVVWAALRMAMGWTFFWAFVDKLFGLGFATEAGKGWIDGGSPTFGFLSFATKGPFVEVFKGMAASATIEWLFLLGLLGIGLPLLLGVGVKIAASTGVVMYLLMYVAGSMPPEHNPFMDEHIIGAIIMLGLIFAAGGSPIGLGRLWMRTGLVKRYPVLA